MRLAAVVTHEPPWYVARLVGAGVAAQGATADEATENLKQAAAAVGPVAEPEEAPVLTSIDVPDGAAPLSAVDRETFVRDAEALGWDVVAGEDHIVLTSPDGAHAVALPVTAREVAPGVFRMVAARLRPDDREAAVRRIQELFARNPSLGDTTRLVREMRDAR